MKKCRVCGREFNPRSNRQIYCCEECRLKVYKNYKYSTPESIEKYREKIKEEKGLDDTGFNYEFRERTASNKGMTVPEYNAYLEERKALKLGISIKELRHYTYLSKKNNTSLYEELGIPKEDYYKKLKSKIILDGKEH